MAKRRTRKQKEKARHQFMLTRQRLDKLASKDDGVKSQFKNKTKAKKRQIFKKEKAKNTAKSDNLGSVRRDIGRSLFLASLVLSLEVMIYFILRN